MKSVKILSCENFPLVVRSSPGRGTSWSSSCGEGELSDFLRVELACTISSHSFGPLDSTWVFSITTSTGVLWNRWREYVYTHAVEPLQPNILYNAALKTEQVVGTTLKIQYCGQVDTVQWCGQVDTVQWCGQVDTVQYCGQVDTVQWCGQVDTVQWCEHVDTVQWCGQVDTVQWCEQVNKKHST